MTTPQAIIPDDIHEAVLAQAGREHIRALVSRALHPFLQKLPVAEQSLVESEKAKAIWK